VRHEWPPRLAGIGWAWHKDWNANKWPYFALRAVVSMTAIGPQVGPNDLPKN